MSALTAEQKAEHINQYLNHLRQISPITEMLGRELVSAVIEYIGHDDFFRVHRTIKAESTYRSVPALQDKTQLAAFVKQNAGLVKLWLVGNATRYGGLNAEEAITSQINNGTLPRNCPYPIKDLQAVINGGFNAVGERRGGKVPSNAAEIKAWFDDFVTQQNINMIAQQGELAILSVTHVDHPSKLVRQAIFDEDDSSEKYADFSSDLVKTLVFLIADTFTSYLNHNR